MATMEQREEQLDELSKRYYHLEERLELEREELDSFREENKRLRKAGNALLKADKEYNLHPGCVDKRRDEAMRRMGTVLKQGHPLDQIPTVRG